VDERHAVDEDLRIVLEQQRVLESSILVRSEGGTVLYEVNLDYEVLSSGARTELRILPGGRLAVGDTTRIDYLYELDQSDAFDGALVNYSFGLRWQMFEAYHRRSYQANGMSRALPVAAFADRDFVVTGLSIFQRTALMTLRIRAEHLRSERFPSILNSYRVTGSSSTRIRRGVTAALGGSWTRSFSGSDETNLVRGEAGVGWQANPFLFLRARVGGYELRSRQVGKRSYLGGGLSASYRLRKLVVTADWSRFTWTDNLERLESRFVIRLSREF
jgi:hypothetical protein